MSKEPKTKKIKYKVSIGDRIISILTGIHMKKKSPVR